MNRGLVLDMGAVQRLNWNVPVASEWLNWAQAGPEVQGIRQIQRAGFLYLLGNGEDRFSDSLLIIGAQSGDNFFESLAPQDRVECFLRILKVALSKVDRGVKIPPDWKSFHSGSLLSFQSNRWSSNIRSRVYADFSPEETGHTFVFALVADDRMPLARVGYDQDLVTDAILGFDFVESDTAPEASAPSSMALTTKFTSSDIVHGVPFSVWKDSKLTKEQLAFFNAPFTGALRLRGAAGTGKTLVLCLRFLKEIYSASDMGNPIRAVFLTHGQETADNIRTYLSMIDERGILAQLNATGDVEVTTLHGLASELVNYDVDEVQPVSFDGADGRKMQMELLNSVVREIAASVPDSELLVDSDFFTGLRAQPESPEGIGFRCDLNDEFSSVLEAFGVREVDEIADRYLRAAYNSRLLAKSPEERGYVLEAYRRFRQLLSDLGVVSLDQFISDFGSYLNSFRWSAVRHRKGYDIVFADELHLFNKHERRVLGYLLKDGQNACRIAVAYDPRQSPRNSFLPNDIKAKDAVWSEANLSTDWQRFELTDVFRYTPEILKLLQSLNQWFPAEDLSEEWGLNFGTSMHPAGAAPIARLYANQTEMAKDVARAALRQGRKSSGRIAVLALDPERFSVYRKSGIFSQGFVAVAARDEIDMLNRFSKRAILSMPEYVAGLQFEHVFLIDANAILIAKLGGGPSGLQRFISAVYLGASRAESALTICADSEAGGFAEPIRQAIASGLLIQ